MASLCSSNEKHNFSCVIIACVDFIKLPLKDILASRIKPVNLYKEIDSCPSLKLNRQCCLRSDQRKVCFIKPPDLPNYADFDASLLYKLIRNLCPSLKPTQGWGKEPNPADTDIGDDIERLRLFRNIYFAHASSAAISDTAFKDLWKNLKSVTGRFQLRMGHCGNYKEELIKIERTKFTHDHLQHYKLLLEAFVRLSPEDEVEPDILIEGEEEVTCGDSASFEAEIKPENIGDWLITWRKRIGNDIRCIDTSMEKYRGSTTRKLVIQSVCKEDQGEYRAILSRSSNGNEYRQSKNTICLRVLGDQPLIKDLQVTTGKHCIDLLCSYEVLGRSPKVSRIAWSKNGEFLNERVISVAESIISESCYKITSPSNEDKGKYSCTITNAVGSVSEEITLDVPSVEIETDSKVCFGSKTTFRSKVSSIPSPKKVEWQTSKDETDYHCIDIEDPKYYGSNAIPECPLLVIPKTTFDDKLYYRLVVLNKIGGGISNTVKINVTGNLPNISTIQETNIKKKFVKLIGNIFLDDDSPGLLEVFWTKNGKKIDNKGSGGRLSEVTIDDPSLIIKEVCHHDAGPYQLTATNAVGPTKSDEIVFDAPDVSFDKINKEDGSQWFVATIQSIPSPCFVQWSLKSMNDDMFTPIDVNSEDYKGTLNTLPHPVLVVKNSNQFEFNSYQIEVANFVGSTIKNIDDQTPQIQNDKGTQTGIETGVMENPLYREPGPGIKFSKLSDYLAENFPREKLKRLKNLLQASGKVQNMTNLKLANSALECFTILQDEMLFSPNDVIFMQFLCKETGCKELYERCIKYASNNKALCFFERPVENGCTNVQFHIQGDLTAYTKEQIKHIVEVVANILDRDIEEILVNGVRPSASFFLVLSVKEAYIWKLKDMNEHNHIRLIRLNIDFIIVDRTTIKLKRQKEADKVWEFPGNVGDYQMANQAVEIVVETSRCRQIVSILSSESVLAVDCEGIALGVEGPMTLLQICTYSGDVYLFDVQENRELFSEGHLKIVLESDEILKVIHACSYDSAALYHQFGVTLQNVFDTQVADTVLEEHNERLLVSSLDLQELCQKYSSSKKVSDYKEQLKIQYSKKEGEFWANRPLTDEMKSVAVGDVRALIPEVFETQKRFIWKSRLQEKFRERVSETIKFYIDDEVRKHRFKRKFLIVNQIIDTINKKWDARTICSDFPEDSDEYEALKRIDYRDACIKSPFIDRLKAESILSDLKELDDKLSKDEKDYGVKWITFSLLSSIIDHPNKTVSKLAKNVKQKLKSVILQEIYVKYTTETNLKHLTKCEKDVLRSLNLNGTNNQQCPQHVVRLYWLLAEGDINNNCKKLIEKENGFKMQAWYYDKIISYLRRGADVPVPLKQSAWTFKRKLDDTFGPDVVPPTLIRTISLID